VKPQFLTGRNTKGLCPYPRTHSQSEVANRILGVHLRYLAGDRLNCSSLVAIGRVLLQYDFYQIHCKRHPSRLIMGVSLLLWCHTSQICPRCRRWINIWCIVARFWLRYGIVFFMLQGSNMMSFIGMFSLTPEIGSGCVVTTCGQVGTTVLRSISCSSSYGFCGIQAGIQLKP